MSGRRRTPTAPSSRARPGRVAAPAERRQHAVADHALAGRAGSAGEISSRSCRRTGRPGRRRRSRRRCRGPSARPRSRTKRSRVRALVAGRAPWSSGPSRGSRQVGHDRVDVALLRAGAAGSRRRRWWRTGRAAAGRRPRPAGPARGRARPGRRRRRRRPQPRRAAASRSSRRGRRRGAAGPAAARPRRRKPARSATSREAWLPTSACQIEPAQPELRRTPSGRTARVARTADAPAAGPGRRPVADLGRSRLGASIETRPHEPSSSPVSASQTANGAPVPAAQAAGAILGDEPSACSRQVRDAERWSSAGCPDPGRPGAPPSASSARHGRSSRPSSMISTGSTGHPAGSFAAGRNRISAG